MEDAATLAGTIQRIAVVGAGFMGHGIGQEFALGGYEVVLHDVGEQALERAVERIGANLTQLAEWGIVAAIAPVAAMARIATTTVLPEAVQEADLVVEAVYEDLALKREVFHELDRLCPARTILASNTSTFMPSLLASATGRPDRVVGMHYFYPPSLLPLVEIVPGPATSAETVATVRGLLRRMGKQPIVVRKECFGFVANRLQFALQREALHLVEQGIASAEEVDIAVRDGFGRRLAFAGPFEIAEPIGWDLELQIQKHLLPHLAANAAPSPLLVDKVDRRELGVKTGKGFYEWTAESAEVWQRRMYERLAGLLRLPRREANDGEEKGWDSATTCP
jgi:3-hydroxybutyryl-CoA dehydrogenase